ncbi:serine/threonine-protein kinase [Sphaerisporangium sp. TRM90804]|uniref:serine/threonine-protein kinase n=1 Tax=Sphaerisporangium sp. TRM90804 TaxID=3031113 RepID=UPI00244D109E|nr:serine/threonine-protein kinase [Sphaerisporangium sp. TRM90804]MDH2423909.1 transporter substrate-binding domain-containing protein [Sphaerisporangium sp. TRM90804]
MGPFRLTGRIGEGGQGVVYLGEDDAGERAAVKLLHVKFSGDLTARSRFARELKAAERVASFCTARVIAADLEGDTPYIASEYIDGRSLRDTVEAGAPLSGARLERLAVGTATALTAIHHAGIVHRDFKPDNVLIAADGPRVVDFGIARLLDSTGTITSRAVGTPAYMAPEQISGGEVGPPADVFAWAATVVFAATGTVPFGGGSIAVVLNRVLNHEVDVAALPEPLRGVVRACLDKSPAARPTADQILLRLLGRPDDLGASRAVLSEGAELAGRETLGRSAQAPAGRAGGAAVRPPHATGVPAGPGGYAGPSVPGGPPHASAQGPGSHPAGAGLVAGPGAPFRPEPAATGVPTAVAVDGAAPRRPRRRVWVVAAALVATLLAGVGAVALLRPDLWPQGVRGGVDSASVPSRGPVDTPTYSSLVDKVAAAGSLTIAMRDYLPGVALDDTDGWQGFEVDVATYVAERLGVPRGRISFRATSKAERLGLLDSGEVDLVIATYSMNADDPVTFAGPYYQAHVDVLVRDGDPITKLSDLRGRVLCSPASNASVGMVQDAVKVRVVAAENYYECMVKLGQGLVDAVPGDDLLLAGFANRENIRYKVLGAELSDERYAVAVRRGDVRACRAINDAITGMYEDGTVAGLLKKHFGKVGFRAETKRPAPARCR